MAQFRVVCVSGTFTTGLLLPFPHTPAKGPLVVLGVCTWINWKLQRDPSLQILIKKKADFSKRSNCLDFLSFLLIPFQHGRSQLCGHDGCLYVCVVF